ncbi:MAG TPA: hypothetical protein VEJ67_03030 [Candidatus Cybelea sp.]|nr:hypothetical protein [Candidatus Cybelea sp.]
MREGPTLTSDNMKSPRAAAIAGIVFATLSLISHLLIRNSIPPNPLGSASDFLNQLKTITFVLTVTPFAGIAFLWFIGVVRDRIGSLEDRFFATVFLGSGLLYIALLFSAAALAGGLLRILASESETIVHSGAYAVSRATIYQLLNVYMIKMAAVFMISVSTIWMRTRIGPRALPFLGYALALVLLVGTFEWAPIVFPLWIYLISVSILIEKFRQSHTQPHSVSAVP